MNIYRTDLAIEEGVNENENYKINDINVSKTIITKETEEKYHKKEGFYYTIDIPDNKDGIRGSIEPISQILKEIYEYLEIKENDKCLIVGLGNDNITPDALGPLVVDDILVTKHLFDMQEMEGLRDVSAMAPGVMGQTGMETSIVVSSVSDTTKPDFLIVVDSLASSSIERVNRTVQITTSGINPGSGIGNKRKEISRNTLNIPVVAIGIPTVVDAVSITNDIMNYTINQLKENTKEEFLGIIGKIDNNDFRKLLFESLPYENYMVTSKDIDEKMDELSKIVAEAINISLHKKVN